METLGTCNMFIFIVTIIMYGFENFIFLFVLWFQMKKLKKSRLN